jgi:hypothetical protein
MTITCHCHRISAPICLRCLGTFPSGSATLEGPYYTYSGYRQEHMIPSTLVPCAWASKIAPVMKVKLKKVSSGRILPNGRRCYLESHNELRAFQPAVEHYSICLSIILSSSVHALQNISLIPQAQRVQSKTTWAGAANRGVTATLAKEVTHRAQNYCPAWLTSERSTSPLALRKALLPCVAATVHDAQRSWGGIEE